MMQAEDVLLKALAENIAWREAAEIIGYAQLVEEELTGGRPWQGYAASLSANDYSVRCIKTEAVISSSPRKPEKRSTNND